MFNLPFLNRTQAKGPGMTGQQNPLQSLLAPEVAFPIAAGLIGNQGNQQNFANALSAAGPAMARRAEDMRNAQKRNATLEFLRQQSPEIAQAVDAGMPVGEAWKSYLKAREAKQPTKPKFSRSPVYGTDEEGRTVLGTVGDDGSFKKIDTGDFHVSTGFDKIDTGTQIILRDKRSGEVVSVTPKENYQEAYDKSLGSGVGKNTAEDMAALESIESKMPGLEQVVEQLDGLAEKATYTMAGKAVDIGRRQLGLEPRDAAVAREEYVAVVNNQVLPLLRDTFGAAFTEAEGQTLRNTLGDPDKSPAEKQAMLKAFIEQKRRDVEALRVQAQGGSTLPQPGAAPSMNAPMAQDPLGIR